MIYSSPFGLTWALAGVAIIKDGQQQGQASKIFPQTFHREHLNSPTWCWLKNEKKLQRTQNLDHFHTLALSEQHSSSSRQRGLMMAPKEDGLIAVFFGWPFHSRMDRVNRTWPSPWSLLHYRSVTIHVSRHLRSSLLGPPLHRPLARDERQWTPKHAVHLPDGVIYWFSTGSVPKESLHPFTCIPHSAE